MIEIFHVSDLHFEKSEKRTKRAKLLLKKIEDEFKIGEAENKYLLITGDTVQDGEKNEYKIALGALIPFKENVCVVPGNHDYGPMGSGYSDNSAKRFDNDLANKLGIIHRFFPKTPYSKILKDREGNKVLLIGLNSCLKTKSILDFAEGKIGKKQRKNLDQILRNQAYKDIPKVIFLHHIPHRRAKGIFMSLKDWRKLMDIVRDRVDVLAFGHEGKMGELEQKEIKKIKMAKQDIQRLIGLRKTSIPIREMKLRSGKGQGIRYYLDANKSVKEQACYRIKIESSKVSARLIKLA
jgi:predicted phosphodiesterase